MAKPRDYKAEYARRVANARAKGYSRSQARGHPRKGESHIGERYSVAPRITKIFSQTSQRIYDVDIQYDLEEVYHLVQTARGNAFAVFLRFDYTNEVGERQHWSSKMVALRGHSTEYVMSQLMDWLAGFFKKYKGKVIDFEEYEEPDIANAELVFVTKR